MPQTSLAEYVEALDKAGLLTRISDEKRVDELPQLMEDNPDTAILVEHVKDCKFPFFANGYGVDPCTRSRWASTRRRWAWRSPGAREQRFKPEMVDTAPCKDVIIKGDDIDLTMFPLFHHHPRGRPGLSERHQRGQLRSYHEGDRPGHLPVHVPVQERDERRHAQRDPSRARRCRAVPRQRQGHADRGPDRRSDLGQGRVHGKLARRRRLGRDGRLLRGTLPSW